MVFLTILIADALIGWIINELIAYKEDKNIIRYFIDFVSDNDEIWVKVLVTIVLIMVAPITAICAIISDIIKR